MKFVLIVAVISVIIPSAQHPKKSESIPSGGFFPARLPAKKAPEKRAVKEILKKPGTRAEWHSYEINSEGSFFYDRHSINRSNTEMVRVWTKQVLLTEGNAYRLALWAISCTNYEFALLEVADFGYKNQAIYTARFEEEWYDMKSESPIASLRKKVCQ